MMQATYPVSSNYESATTTSDQTNSPQAKTFPKALVVRNVYNEVDAIVFGPEPPMVESPVFSSPNNFAFSLRRPFWR